MRSSLVGSSVLVLIVLSFTGFVGCSEDDPIAPEDDGPGSLEVTVEGLPGGLDVTIEVIGPHGFDDELVNGGTLTDLAPGVYTIFAPTPVSGYDEYEPASGAIEREVAADARARVTVSYAARTTRGHLQIDVQGIPDGSSASVEVSGPSGFRRLLDDDASFESVFPGTYTVRAHVIGGGDVAYVPNAAVTTVGVDAGETEVAVVEHTAEDVGDADFEIVAVEMIQAIQTPQMSVPIVRNRPALLRLDARATSAMDFVPEIELEVWINGQLVDTIDVDSGTIGDWQGMVTGDLESSPFHVLPGQYVQPALELVFTVDPGNEIFETDETDNVHIVSDLVVASIDPLPMTLVPVRQNANGATADVDASSAADYVAVAGSMYPFPNVDVNLRSVYTTDAPVLQGNDENGAWGTILQEVQALHQLDGSDDYYFGVVPVTYGSGYAGLGYVPRSRADGYNTAIGWDRDNSRARVLAHELGHNLGRNHAPCGGASGSDPGYPYSDGSIGHWGIDLRDQRLYDPGQAKDIMSYCTPQWVSAYTYEAILQFMGATLTRQAPRKQPCLLVWGRIVDGAIVLDPAAVVDAVPHLPTHAGDYRVVAHDTNGRRLVDFSFDPPVLGHGDDSVFVWTVPIDPVDATGLASIEVNGRGDRERIATEALPPARRIPIVATREGDRAALQWDATTLPLAIVRDARAGTVMAIGRTGSIAFPCTAAEIDVVFSDGARTLDWSQRLD